jgi:curli biogenesis system outer membrane secretion channel CsgG
MLHLNSYKNFPAFLFVLALLPVLFLNGQADGQPPKKPRTAPTRILEQPTAEKEQKNVNQTTEVAEKTRPAANRAKKVMVTDFDARGIAKWWGGNWDIGSLFANSMIGLLSRTDGYEVVERSRMKEVFDEQGLSESERFNQGAVTKVGRLLGADYILFGYLTDFTRKKGGFGPYKEVSARISYSVRLVDVATGKVYKTAEITYVSPKQKDFALTAEQELNPNDPEFLQSLFGKAINEAAKNSVSQLTGENTGQTTVQTGGTNDVPVKTPVADTSASAKVADITDNTITINRGRLHGVREGHFFVVVKVVKVIKDPDTGAVISQKTEELARLKITKVDDSSAEGALVTGDVKLLNVGTELMRVDAKKQ